MPSLLQNYPGVRSIRVTPLMHAGRHVTDGRWRGQWPQGPLTTRVRCQDVTVHSMADWARRRGQLLGRAVALVLLAVTVASCSTTGSSLAWTPQRSAPFSSGFNAIDCPSAESCVALLGDASSARLDGSTWSSPVPIEKISGSLAPFDISCVSTTLCFTFDGLGHVLTYNGQQWSKPVLVEPASTDATINDISCASAHFCAIGDSNGDASFYNGKSWSKLAAVADSSGIAALSCPAVGVCFAVDAQSDEVFHYVNGRWSISAQLNMSTPQGGSEPNSLSAISCGDRAFCVALDDFGEAFTYDGKWTTGPHTFDNIQDSDDELSCTAAQLCVIIDDSNNVVDYDNGAWSAARLLRTKATIGDVACALRARCVIVDGGGGYFIGKSAKAK
jgi:hypothetical protein